MEKGSESIRDNRSFSGLNGAPRIEIRPFADIVETKEGIVMYLDMPGSTSEGLDIQVEKNVLTVGADVVVDELQGYRLEAREFRPKSYRRSFTLTEGIDVERISAALKDGVLRLELPKSERVKPRKIEVKAI